VHEHGAQVQFSLGTLLIPHSRSGPFTWAPNGIGSLEYTVYEHNTILCHCPSTSAWAASVNKAYDVCTSATLYLSNVSSWMVLTGQQENTHNSQRFTVLTFLGFSNSYQHHIYGAFKAISHREIATILVTMAREKYTWHYEVGNVVNRNGVKCFFKYKHTTKSCLLYWYM